MTWDAYNRRKEVLRAMLEVADRRRDVTLTELMNTVEGGREAFVDETELLLDLQMTWFQRLSGQLDRLVAEGAETPELVAITAWVNAAGQMPGARALLDANRDDPALGKAYAKEHSFLAASAGVPTYHSDHLARGQRIAERARDSAMRAVPAVVVDEAPHGLMARLRSAIAA